MKVKEEQYNWLTEQVYWVDKLKTDKDYTPEANKTYPFNPKKRELGNFKVIEVKDNTSNGMQAMAVAPVGKNGDVDYSHVVIAYAGTNSSDMKDIETDLQSLGLGRYKLQLRTGLNSAKVVDSQFVTALNYAKVSENSYLCYTIR